ncbi:UNVERIFIED_CONTAM: hypothetical protein PYX00_002942 [Menopon gallinae]|uniref:Sodium/bile acid cotransporter 7 n=1 Tax=Menopon gallinae TaxID=328185 RepID=A0AAW2HZQ8_9NEOP
MNNRIYLSDAIKQNSFTIGILFMILLAEIAPWIGAQGGPLYPEITVKYLAVALIFFISGLTLEGSEFTEALRCFRLHVFIQTFSFFITPIIIQVFLFLFVKPFGLNSWILKGIVTVGCMPPPVSSAVVLTKAVGGNEAAAIFNSAVGTFLGIVLTPILLLTHVGLASTLPVISILVQIIQTVILPIMIGQLTRLTVNRNFLSRIPFSLAGQLALLFIIYTSFCDLFSQNDFTIDAHHIILTIFLVAVIQVILIFVSFKVSTFLSKKKRVYTVEDVIAITFCSTHKSLTLGMPLLRTLYSGYSHLSQISLPLLVYHPIQLILGGFLVPYGQKLIKKTR